MVNENLLATYALLSFINETHGADSKDSMLYVFEPIVCEGLNKVIRAHGGKEVMGKDYTEIREGIIAEFCLDIPVAVLASILPIVSKNNPGVFTLNKDHSFILNGLCNVNIIDSYADKKNDLKLLRMNYKAFCKGQGVDSDFDELVKFIQDQKNRIFEKKSSEILSQGYHVSKYVYSKIKKRDRYFDIICDLYLGGIIASYLRFNINERVADCELLLDTNFYISLINLNTEEAHDTCLQLYNTTVAMGYRYSILESTIEQIKILLSSRVERYRQKDLLAAIDVADILAACNRLGYSRDDLNAFKDNVKETLSQLGVTTVYNSSIRNLVDKAEKSSELTMLSRLRGSRESALNDLIANEYVDYRRKGKSITEFNEVNCWFLNNSYSINKAEIQKPIWQRRHINASDLMVLLWYANPSLSFGNSKECMAIASLSAGVIKYRSEKYPTIKTIDKIQAKIAQMQTANLITQKSIANLCIRMSEGCIDNNEAERLLTMSTEELSKYIEELGNREEVYLDEHKQNEELTESNMNLKKELISSKVEGMIQKHRFYGVIYLICFVFLYIFTLRFVPENPSTFWGYVIHFVCWLLSTVCVNWFTHSVCLDGLVSILKKDFIRNKYIKILTKE